MEVIVLLLGIYYIAMSSLYILYTRETISIFKRFIDRYELRYLAAIPAIVGLLFLSSANATIYPWVFRIIAVISFAKAALALANPNDIYNKMAEWYIGSLSDRVYRLLGVIGVIFGTVILTWIK